PVARRSRYLAFTGAGVLAAAAVAGFVLLRSSRSDDVARENAKAGSAAPIVALGQPIQPPAAAAPAAAPPPAPPPTPTVEPIQPEAPRDEVTATPPTRALMPEHKGAPGHRAVITTRPKTVITKVASGEPAAVATDRPAAPAKPAAKQGKDDTSDPSFDALLKEAGVDEPKKPARPKLDKKELSGDDFKRGMDAVAARAQACYKGTTGTAAIKLKIDPSGKITSVKVTGAFAGKPEGDCVSAAVKGASFPPWDGSPESFSYSYLLTE
ncbi:MAG TPA: hypothetical protein VLX92_17955, partial [Kofleriaceae bacterium]|nr:hypothetical protein [Kofleriaceae bacterium]